MPPGVLKADDAGRAFQEAQMLQNLKHPNIIKLFNIIQMPDTKIVLFMEHIQGGNLQEYVDSKGGRIAESEVQKIMF